jgi:glycosyltransferase involved in cell wall biosynthesis
MYSVGVVIPCHEPYFKFIPTLLENIDKQSVKPNQVIISCSSWMQTYELNFNYNTLPVKILFTKEILNQAANRNRAAMYSTADIITFIDADDIIHPRKIEYVINTFQEKDVDVVYHTFVNEHISNYCNEFNPTFVINSNDYRIVKDPIHVGIMIDRDSNIYPLHHSHISIRKDVFDKIKFPEDQKYYRMEDSIYGVMLLEKSIKMAFIHYPLTRYTIR